MKKTLAKDEAALKAFSTKIMAASGSPNVPLAVASPTFTNITTSKAAAAAVVKPSKPAPIPYQLGFDTHELTYLGYDAILDSMPHTGHYVLWQLDANAPTKAAGRATPYTAIIRINVEHAVSPLAYLGFDTWLEYAPSTGAYALHAARTSVGASITTLCAPLCDADGCGVSADLAGDTKVLYRARRFISHPSADRLVRHASRREGSCQACRAVADAEEWPTRHDPCAGRQGDCFHRKSDACCPRLSWHVGVILFGSRGTRRRCGSKVHRSVPR